MRRIRPIISAQNAEIDSFVTYVWERKAWPDLTCDVAALTPLLVRVAREQGKLRGRMESLGFDLRGEAYLHSLTEDVVKSSEIEGEALARDQVRSSLARRLGMDIPGLVPAERHVDGIVEMMVDATRNFDKKLTAQRLFGWHSAMFPAGRTGMHQIKVGAWRDDSSGPMRVVSGAVGKEKVHFEAPPARRVAKEMEKFLRWFAVYPTSDPLLFAGEAHLWFVTIHPFEDGNGRIARAISDMALARAEDSAQRYYSMSSQIRVERNSYYDRLERTQKGDTDITAWQEWFLNCLLRAIEGAQASLEGVLLKARFWDRFAREALNARQKTVLNRLLTGFEGNLTTSKWAKLTKSSQDTAHRDILDLVDRGALRKDAGGGRSTSYSLVLE
jgi:Fic family protein